MIKKTLVLLCLSIGLKTLAQNPAIMQQRCLGGSRWEGLGGSVDAQVTKDSGYIVISNTKSEDGDVTGLHTDGTDNPPHDIWVVKLNKYGGIQWQKCYGGSGVDIGKAVDTGAANTYFIVGTVQSNDGDIAGIHGAFPDGWVAKINSNGNIIWKKCIGGTSNDEVRSVRSTPDGGCIVAGYSYSNDGDISGHHNAPGTLPDAWLVKLDASGKIEWSKCYGSTKTDVFDDILVTTDGKYIVAGASNGRDGDVTGNHTGISVDISDGWALKIDNAGNIIWKYCYGGDESDGFSAVRQARDGGYIFAGSAASSCCEQVLGNHAANLAPDAWVVKTDAAGSFTWGRCYGGVFYENAASITVLDDGYAFVGSSQLNHGDVQGPAYGGGSNIWVAKVSLTGALTWQSVLGGDRNDAGGAILTAFDGYPVLFAITSSQNGDVKRFHTPSVPGVDVNDIWFAKFNSFNTVRLNGFADFNSNNIKDPAEPFFPDYKADVYRNNTLVETNYSAGDTLQVYIDSGKHTIQPLAYNNYYTPVPATIPVDVTGFFKTLDATVAFKPAGNFNDLTLKIIPVAVRRRGGSTNVYRLAYENIGTTTINAPYIQLVKDARMTYIQSSTLPSSVSNDTIKYTISALAPLTKGFIDVTLKNSTALLLNDTVTLRATIYPLTSDVTEADNTFQQKEMIIGSYDPNDKTENHGGQISRAQVTTGEYLNYTIRFQNTGNDTAFLVVVKDTLSSQYDLSSMEIIGVSHPNKFERVGNICTWSFYDINLVDSNHNEPASHGYINFRIKAKNTTLEGDTIKNSASIYFDYNPPVITDKSLTVVKTKTVTAVSQLTPETLIKIFPNPVTDGSFFIQSAERLKGDIYVEVFNEAGKTVARYFIGRNLNNFTKNINIQSQPKGNYIIVVGCDNAKYSYKLIKAN